MRLGVYSDMRYWSDGETLSTNRAFVRFVTSLPPRVQEVTLFGRLDTQAGSAPYALPSAGVRFVPLPWYPRLTALGGVTRAVRGSCQIFAHELGRLDAVWIFGPHPLAVAFAAIARRRGTPVFLGVRQDYPCYIANRLPSRAWSWALPLAHALDLAFRRLAARAPTVVLGEELARKYGGRAPVLSTGFSLVPATEVASPDEAVAKSWAGDLRLLSVGRLDPEKNPLLLADVVAGLRRRDPRWHLTVAGDGPMRNALEARLRELRVSDAVELLGEVPSGPRLWNLYRASHAFLHVSFTEGLPQVIVEANAAGLPLVATAVGGVPAALGEGSRGLLVPPGNADAVVDGLVRLDRDANLRRQLIEAGLRSAKKETMEAQLDAIAFFFHSELERGSYAGTARNAVAAAAAESPRSSQK